MKVFSNPPGNFICADKIRVIVLTIPKDTVESLSVVADAIAGRVKTIGHEEGWQIFHRSQPAVGGIQAGGSEIKSLPSLAIDSDLSQFGK